MDVTLSICAGIALAAACGFRVFVPLFALSVATKMNLVTPASSFTWIGSWSALVVLGAATLVEVIGYLIPVVDHLLDTVATPAAAVAGVVASASVMVDVPPAVQWVAAIVAGGGAAALVQIGTVTTRAASTASTVGVGNPIFAALESLMSVALAVLALVVPIVAGIFVAITIAWVSRAFYRHRLKTRTT